MGKQTWKVIPNMLRSVKGLSPVVRIEALPAGSHPTSPIQNDLVCVVCTLANGDRRYFGTADARIGSDLCMHMVINTADEVLKTWKDSEDFSD